MHIFLEKWNVMSIVKPFYLINLIRLITFLGFRDNDIMSLTRDGRGIMGGTFIGLKGYACGSFTLKSNPLTLLNLYTINSPSRSFYKPNGQNSLPFQILQLVKVSPLSYTTLLYKTGLFR